MVANSPFQISQDTFVKISKRSPDKSIRQASNELQILRSVVHDIVHKKLRSRTYKFQLLHHFKPKDHCTRLESTFGMMNRIGVNSNFLKHVIFSDEPCFHVCGKVNKHNCRTSGNENPHGLCEYERDIFKVKEYS
ncbi:DUF4817 domain-containing protein [Trichonephila clavipes]|nr:DUF4817 domain-containing protein [Trichonephila clavipes]